MKFRTQRRLAARILKCGKNRIWFDPNRLTEVKDAITRQDVRSLIKDLAIQKHAVEAVSGFRRKARLLQKRKGRLGGMGSRKGKKHARLNAKLNWMRKVRAQRGYIKNLKNKGKITPKDFNRLYRISKGGFFRSRKHIQRYMEEHGLIKHEAKKVGTAVKEKETRQNRLQA